MITVWGRRNSMNVQKVMWALGELKLDYIRHDIAGSFGVDDAYLALNPGGTVPTIQDGDLTLYESNACVRYLARQYGSGSLAPDNAAQFAIADQWMDWQCANLSNAFFMIFVNMIRLPADKANMAQRDQGLKQTARLLGRLGERLEGREYLVDDTLTMADIPIGAILYRYFTLDIERPSLPAVEAYYARLTDRPAYRKHVMIPFGTNADEWLIEEKKSAGVQ